jgi:hypothetical protein
MYSLRSFAVPGASLLFLLSLAACGSSKSDDADKGAGSEACGYDADFCAAAGKNCGSFGLVDKCGVTRTVQCGDCKGPQSCGGGGAVNVCGASCEQGCPASFSCNESGVCAGGGSRGLALDLRTVTVTGSLTLDGGPLGSGSHCTTYPTDAKLRVSFEDPTNGSSFSADVACGTADSFTLALEPGTYRVTTSSIYDQTSNVPSGTFVLDPSFVVKADAHAAFDLKTAPLTGSLTLDGGPLGTGSHCTTYPSDAKARVELVEVSTGASFSADVACNDATDSFSVRVGAGTYRASVATIYDQTSNLPSGTFGVAAPVTPGGAPVKIDVKTAPLAGKLTLNGGPLGSGSHCTTYPTDAKVRVTFTDATGGGDFSADVPCGGADDGFSLRLAQGTYRVSASTIYDQTSSLPSGTFVLADSFVVTGTTAPAAFDVKTVPLTGSLTLNGGPLGTGSHCQTYPTDAKVRVTFVDTTTHAEFSADSPCSAGDTFALQLAPGTYAVTTSTIYDQTSGYPSGTFLVNPSFAVPASAGATFDLKTIPVDGHVTLNGASLGIGSHCTTYPSDAKLRLTFTDASATPIFGLLDLLHALPTTSTSADVTCGAADAFALQIPPGTYRIAASSIYDQASSLPSGTFTAVGRIDLH